MNRAEESGTILTAAGCHNGTGFFYVHIWFIKKLHIVHVP